MIRLNVFLCGFLAVAVLPLSKTERVYDRDVSRQKHTDENDNHNPQYDHEAFLGEEESKRYDELTAEESQASLLKLVEDHIDSNKDGSVSEEELRAWIAYTSLKYLRTNRDKRWKELKLNDDDLLEWDSYKLATYGRNDPSDEAKLLAKDRKRWEIADVDGDNKLNKEEFLSFLHPEEASHMKDFVVEDAMDDIDLNHDGFIDLQEYMHDMWQPDYEGEVEPDWVLSEKQQFGVYHDKNKDGHLDREEVRDWILPEYYDHVDSETKHLMSHADINHDNSLSKEEILGKFEIFVGSQATDFGEALGAHEEL